MNDHVVRNVAAKWRELGVQLLQSDQTHELDIIAANHPQDVVRCCQCVLEKWRETNVGATWNHLTKALKQIQLDYLASELENKLKPECKVTAIYCYKCVYN